MVASIRPLPYGQPPGPGRPADLTSDDVRWLAWHEACSHALIGREVRDLGDAVLLYDATDREPFWNRIAGVNWPSGPGAFDRRLTEALALFAGLDRIPHVWPTPGYDEPVDLTARLVANGFEDHGGGLLMAFDPAHAIHATPTRSIAGVTVERLHLLTGEPALEAAREIAGVLLASFVVEPERRIAMELEAVQGLITESYHAILARIDGEPAAVARRTTFAGASYLSSIGTDPSFRGRGLGRLVTALAVEDALADASRWTYLGVFEENAVARALYGSLGFVPIGGVAPDLLLPALNVTPPDEPLAWLGADAGRVRTVAEIWATVDLERALSDLRHGAVVVGDPRAVLDDPLLGARVLLLPSDGDGRRIALAEPSTEGRLAATLARHGEGRVGTYLAAPVDLDVVRTRAAAANVSLSRTVDGPFGRSVLVLTGVVTGPHVILVERPAVPSPP